MAANRKAVYELNLGEDFENGSKLQAYSNTSPPKKQPPPIAPPRWRPMRCLARLFLFFEHKLLQLLLARFSCRQIAARHWGTADLIDCSSIIIDELNHSRDGS